MASSPTGQTLRSRGRLRVEPSRAGAAFALVLVLMLVAGCGGSSSSSTSSSTASNASAPAAPKSVTIAGATITENPTLHAILPASIKASGSVTVGEDPTEPPWGYYSPPGSTHWAGAEYALGQAIGAELGIKFDAKEQLFTGLIPGILAGKYQIGLANMGDTKVREKTLNFVDYLYDGDGLLVAKGNPHNVVSLAQLCGLPIAITAGSTFLTFAQNENKPICGSKPYSILTFPDDADTFLAVKSGKAVGTLTDIAEAAYVARTSGGGSLYTAVHDPKLPQGYDVAWIGMAVTKSGPQLATAMVAAEQALVKSGAERTILNSFGLGFFAGTTPKLNACSVPSSAC
jgi:polar amino acid transport system substrate-binding protein